MKAAAGEAHVQLRVRSCFVGSSNNQLERLIDGGFDWAPGNTHAGSHPESYYGCLLEVLQEVPSGPSESDDLRDALDQLFLEIADPNDPLRVR